MSHQAVRDTGPKPSNRTRLVLAILIALLALALALWLFGPREPVETSLTFEPAAIGEDVEAYLAESEAHFDDIVEGAQKQIVWAFPNSKARTPVALVYLHGFSASAGELRPATDMAAEALQANLYYARLAGHGRTGAAMAEARVQDWMNDVAEAVAIGERLGERIVLVGTSTGATLAAIAALHRDLAGRIDALVLVSPNFKVRAGGSQILTAPFARTLVPMIVGAERGFEPENERHARYWTESYPSTALLPMAAAVAHARGLPFEKADVPALFVFDDADGVVDHTVTRRIAERWGGRADIVTVEATEDPYRHVVAGDALSPGNNRLFADTVAEWIEGL